MQKELGAVLAALMTFSWSELAAQKKLHACSLLTGGEIGGKAGQFQESDVVIPGGPSKGETMGVCMWSTGNQGMLSLNIIRAPKGAQREAGSAQLNQVFAQLRAKGWTEEKKDFGNTKCMVMTPPASEKDSPLGTGCFAKAKGMGISLTAMGRQKVAIEKVKALIDKAIARLP